MSALTTEHLKVATGYFELGMAAEAHEELSKVPQEDALALEVLDLRVQIYRNLERWDAMRTVALMLTDGQPDNPQWPLSLAFATRHLHGPERAIGILMEATEQFPKESAVYYDLACCEALSGNVETARRWLDEACRLAPGLRKAAAVDMDLAALRGKL